MSKIQLTISPSYVKSWGILEALRELMQNCIDRQTEEPDATIILNYEPLTETMIIGSRKSNLPIKTLLLGETTKANNKNAIGTYGEGYKLAILVLIRTGVTIEIENGKELWQPYFVKSRKFDAQVLTIEQQRGHKFQDLVFKLRGISPEAYNDFQNKCLYFHPRIETIDTSRGRILLDEQYQKQIYCEGLFICTLPSKLKYGYDMKAPYCQLDRDRNKVQSFNLLWEVGQMYAELPDSYHTMICKIMDGEYSDVDHFDVHANKSSKLYQDVCNMQYNAFMRAHGQYAVFVKDLVQAQYIKEKFNDRVPVIVPEKIFITLQGSPHYQEALKTNGIRREDTPYTLMLEFLKENKKTIFGTAKRTIEEKLLPMARDWRMRR